jgi:hypothetical protein
MFQNLMNAFLPILLLNQVVLTFSNKIDINTSVTRNENDKSTGLGRGAQYNLPYPLASLLSRTEQINGRQPDSVFRNKIATENTTTAILQQEKNEPRAKTYSYFYLARKVWYVPLLFTLYFLVYIAALIIRATGRHKVWSRSIYYSIF